MHTPVQHPTVHTSKRPSLIVVPSTRRIDSSKHSLQLAKKGVRFHVLFKFQISFLTFTTNCCCVVIIIKVAVGLMLTELEFTLITITNNICQPVLTSSNTISVIPIDCGSIYCKSKLSAYYICLCCPPMTIWMTIYRYPVAIVTKLSPSFSRCCSIKQSDIPFLA